MKKYLEISEKLKISRDMKDVQLDYSTEEVLVIQSENLYKYDFNMVFGEIQKLYNKYNLKDIEISADKNNSLRLYFSFYNKGNLFIPDIDINRNRVKINLFNEDDSPILSKDICEKINNELSKFYLKRDKYYIQFTNNSIGTLYYNYMYIWRSYKDSIIRIYLSDKEYSTLKNMKFFI